LAALSAEPAGAADLSSLGIETAPPPEPVIQPGPNTYIDFLDEVRFARRRIGRDPDFADRLSQQHRRPMVLVAL
jgi:hypothetical protein